MASTPSHIDTLLLHSGIAEFNPKTQSAPVALPSMRTSTVRFANMQALDQAIAEKSRGERAATYGRAGMDTHAALEQVFCDLEGAQRAFLAPSGLSAITLAFLALLNTGDHVLVADCVYGPVRYLDKTVLGRLGIEVSYCRAEPQALEAQLRLNTRMLYIESPGSLLFEMLDIPALSEFARKHGLVLVDDNTWGAGYVYKPLHLGADVSVVAGTKYIGGHSDLMLGAVMAKDPDLVRRINETHYAMGYSISADDAWLALRGVRTLPLRMRQHAANALEICRYLAARPETLRLFHPAFPDDSGHALWKRDCQGSNGMLAVELALNEAQARRFVDSLQLFSIGYSWGGFESLTQLVEPSALAVHGYWQDGGADRSVVRLHIGLEAPQDLMADLDQAFQAARQ
ncbi:trans-sulfuration enzyme family protein [Pusillimonas noertemannii]|uniref:Cystathionine beta-lyase n=1 Tax=Pusillimonas noertemannii TaxID=305977 RepID=A0A2U1CIG9_9BURK|nr:PLP-dependent aspartate aminotransferase family protein [Pusillimonas noertemannii]NYT70395.1 PLP-dependent transferase [Pusillimonas noertemannii]PVY60784.1 cystathionine beta-lyase [Pusillimonas noertemannii]TFL08604.1 PLP-dependent transferase [Pusillimonas noertemannii]